MITVTKTFLPPIEEYQAILKRAWDKQWITNRGELVLELEEKLKTELSVKNIIVTNNGTIPLQIALKILARKGEVITTPFSYVATTASIVWENCTPVFVDINPVHLTIDENKIESAITPRTTAILATHVFGNPCNIEVIDSIAKKYKLKVIYDAAHCFGVKYKGESIFNFGDVSTCSFHATKLFHTGEGGAMFCNNDELNHQLFYSHNFGHNGPYDFFGVGINGKISELQAAMGLAVLPYMDEILSSRKKAVNMYDELLNWGKIRKMELRNATLWNYSYYPIILESEDSLLKVQKALNEQKIYSRRYFYPSLNTLNYLESSSSCFPISEDICSKILCLPLYNNLEIAQIKKICSLVNYCFFYSK
jgi:dTDP-4-amino-4,6-dideoxygalactose transaminase